VRLYRDLLNNGIHDYILKPLQPHVLHDALVSAQAIFSAPRHGRPRRTITSPPP
jgi:pilus assembly protein CpaE